jgi:hypothetical protein
MVDFDTKSAEYVFFFVIMGLFVAVLCANLIHACTKRTLGPSHIEQVVNDIQHDCNLNDCQPIETTWKRTIMFEWPEDIAEEVEEVQEVDEEYDEDEEYLPPTDDENMFYTEQRWMRPRSRLCRVNDPDVDFSISSDDEDLD